MFTSTTTSLSSCLTTRVVVLPVMRPMCISLYEKHKQKPTYKLVSKTPQLLSKQVFPILQSKRPAICRSLPESMMNLDKFIKESNLVLVSHAIVNFSAIYFSLNWVYYRRMREKMEEEDKKKK